MITWFVPPILFKCSITCIDLSYAGPTLHPWVETKLIMVHDPLHVFLNLACKYFVGNKQSLVFRQLVCSLFCCCLVGFCPYLVVVLGSHWLCRKSLVLFLSGSLYRILWGCWSQFLLLLFNMIVRCLSLYPTVRPEQMVSEIKLTNFLSCCKESSHPSQLSDPSLGTYQLPLYGVSTNFAFLFPWQILSTDICQHVI